PLSALPCGFSPAAGFAACSPFSPLAAFGAFSGAPLSAFEAFEAFSAWSGFFFSISSAIDLGSRTLGESHLLVPLNLEADAGRLAVLGIGDRHIGQMERQLLGDDAALLLRGLALVALDHVDAAHQHAVLRRAHLEHLAAATLVAAGEHDHLVALP